jgi:drug/metabolite transporter (DMT)-like permease
VDKVSLVLRRSATPCRDVARASERARAETSMSMDANASPAKASAILIKAAETAATVSIWIVLSAGVILFNKYILSVYGFPFPIALTMIHMSFCSMLAFVLVRVAKVVPGASMSKETYVQTITPIAALFALSLWCSNSAYIYLSVAFIQMLKAMSPVVVFAISCGVGIETYSHAMMANMAVITVGVMIASYGELNFNAFGFLVQCVAIVAESFRIVSVQILLGKSNLKLNSITTLYYVSPACFVFLTVPFVFLELPKLAYGLEITHSVHASAGILLGNAFTAFLLNVAIYLLIGRTSALSLNVAGVVKDWILIGISALIFEAPVTTTQIIGYLIAFGGVCYYNYAKLTAQQKAAVETTQASVELKEPLAPGKGDTQA